MRKTLTDKGVLALKPKAKRYPFPDPELRGHYVIVQPTGTKTFWAVTRNPAGAQNWVTVGATDKLGVDDARKKARKAIERLREGKPAFETAPTRKTFEYIAGQWLTRYVRAKGLRSEGEVTRLLEAHVYPRWKNRDILEIRRSHVTALLDHVEDDHSARQADAVLAVVRGIFNWHNARTDDFVAPTVRGMRRTDPKKSARDRKLTDDELRLIWKTAEGNGSFGAFIRLALLTAQRRAKLVTMKWSDIDNGTWVIDTAKREKGNAGALVLPDMALDIIASLPRLGDNPYVFAGRGNGHLNGFSKAKKQFDAKLPDIPAWTIHDLRRTSRSLMSARWRRPANMPSASWVTSNKASRQLTTDTIMRDEKADALKRLAALVDTILHPRRGNVTPIQRAV